MESNLMDSNPMESKPMESNPMDSNSMSSLPVGPKAKLIGDVQNRTALKNVKARRFYVKCGKLQISPLLTTRTPVPDYVLNFSCVYTLRITHTDQLLQPNLF